MKTDATQHYSTLRDTTLLDATLRDSTKYQTHPQFGLK